MTSGSTSDAYAQNADFWARIIREGLDRYRTELTDQAVLNAVGEVEGLDVLDAGCGEGYLSRLLAERGSKPTGVDASESLILYAQNHAVAQHFGIRYSVANLEKLPYPDNSFDVAVCNHVFSDVEDVAAAIREISRVLRPGGRVVVLMLHPCFYTAHAERDPTGSVQVEEYFSERVIDQPFRVAGIESPGLVHMKFRPLEFYVSKLTSSSFLITGMSEPHPGLEMLKDHWWRENFKRPLFLLIAAQLAEK